MLKYCFFMLFFSLSASLAIAQTCGDSIPASIPDDCLTDNGEDGISDIGTGLVWKKCVEGLSGFGCAAGAAGNHAWRDALARTGVVDTSGDFTAYPDWRLPNIKELGAIVERKCFDPAIDLTYFTSAPASYILSCAASAGNPYSTWYVQFYHGIMD